MSEYQYYEWQTLDRPLTPEEQAAVNELSSHIDVTSSRAVVTYSWGDFKHDPIQVLAHYFDAFLYLANWGSKRLALRFPKNLLDARQIEPYLGEYCIELQPVGDVLILDISLDEEEGTDWIEGEGWLSSLSRLRDDILEGDYRALYLAWLRAAELQNADDDEPEPPVPPGLGDPSPPLASFHRVLRPGQVPSSKLQPRPAHRGNRCRPSRPKRPSPACRRRNGMPSWCAWRVASGTFRWRSTAACRS
jgi:hypothetical protein